MDSKLWNVLTVCAVIVTICVVTSSVVEVMTTLLPAAEVAVPRDYQCDVYTEQGCAKFVVASGGELEVQSGGVIDFQSGSTLGMAAALDMGNSAINNIGNAGTDFNSEDGGLVTAGGITITTGGLNVTAGGVEMNDTTIVADIDSEHIMLPTVASTAFTYTAAAGGTVVLWTVADGEVWIVHDIYCNVTADWDCTGDDVLVNIGDDTDPDGLCDLDDAELQAADTEVTGAPAGWQCMSSGDTIGAFFTSGRGFIYAPSGAAQTIDAVIDETSGETITAGTATCYIVYTRIQ